MTISLRNVVILALIGSVALLMGCQPKTTQIDQMGISDQAALEDLAPENQPQQVPTTIEEPATQPTPAARMHVVRKGDSLYKLARQYYNDQRMWRLIWQANIDQVPDPNVIEVGQQLLIP